MRIRIVKKPKQQPRYDYKSVFCPIALRRKSPLHLEVLVPQPLDFRRPTAIPWLRRCFVEHLGKQRERGKDLLADLSRGGSLRRPRWEQNSGHAGSRSVTGKATEIRTSRKNVAGRARMSAFGAGAGVQRDRPLGYLVDRDPGLRFVDGSRLSFEFAQSLKHCWLAFFPGES